MNKQHDEADADNAQIGERHEIEPVHIALSDIAIDGDLCDVRPEQLAARLQHQKKERDREQLPVRPQITQNARHQAGVVSLTEDLVFLMNFLAHGRPSARAMDSTSRAKFWRR